jgi:type III secretion protein L
MEHSVQQPEAVVDELPAGPGSRIIHAADAEAWQDGLEFYLRARRQAERVEAAALGAHAAERARGYAEGRAEGEREAARLLIETVAAVDRYIATLQREIAGLAMTVIRRVIGEIEVPDLVARVAARAVPEFRRSKWLTVKVHPDAAVRVTRALEEVIKDQGFCCTIEADPTLGLDACILASEFAIVDAGIETQLAAFADAFGAPSRKAQP